MKTGLTAVRITLHSRNKGWPSSEVSVYQPTKLLSIGYAYMQSDATATLRHRLRISATLASETSGMLFACYSINILCKWLMASTRLLQLVSEGLRLRAWPRPSGFIRRFLTRDRHVYNGSRPLIRAVANWTPSLSLKRQWGDEKMVLNRCRQ